MPHVRAGLLAGGIAVFPRQRPDLRKVPPARHYDDAKGDATRLAVARRHVRVDGIATECGMARGDPARLPAMLAAHARAAEIAP